MRVLAQLFHFVCPQIVLKCEAIKIGIKQIDDFITISSARGVKIKVRGTFNHGLCGGRKIKERCQNTGKYVYRSM